MNATTTRSVLGPLTTTYTVPAACSNLVQVQGDGQTAAWQAQSCSISTLTDDTWSDIVNDDASCWPSATTTAPAPPLEGWGFYSPGLLCPSGWTSACTAAILNNGQSSPIISGTSFTFQFSPTAGETAVGCCPSGYSCFGINPQNAAQTCLSRASSSTFPRVTCTDGQFTTESFTLPNTYATSTSFDSDDDPLETSTLVVGEMSLFAPLIQLNWKASDQRLLASPTPNVPTQSPIPSHHGLSTGGKIAIGVVIPVVALSVAGFLMRYLYRRKRHNRGTPAAINRSAYHDTPELDAMPGHFELSGATKAQELSSERFAETYTELPADTREHDVEDSS